ncbi:hypothetical protein [Pseudonocardia abyssalis]|uniref:Uncharacterized protein n=1 Tax=Pseudonocardia abyssalis TaxID=2792008 RepID=A0ABS6UU06_9PSEU|nr:hypothetical protein [Pseudonocardia abyssalis]MBW0114571.1 hypothetical protein [Pseudonocardia abyssalis]MBW0135738.1 hypothetical protein [Pseudonocardia abyssalis]
MASLQGAPASEQELTEYTSGELAFLAGDGLKRAVEVQLGLAPVDFTAVEDSQTSVVRLTAVSASQQEAVRIVQTALDLYSARRAEQAASQTEQSLAVVDRALAELNRPDADVDAAAAAIDRLQNLRLDVILQSSDGSVNVIEPPAPAPAVGSAKWLLPTVLGLALGGLSAVAVLLGRRALSSRVESIDDVLTVVDRVLQPEILVRGGVGEGPLSAADRRTARLLVAQIFAGQPISGRVVVAAGISDRSGTTTVASLIAAGAADYGPTVLLRRGRPASGDASAQETQGLSDASEPSGPRTGSPNVIDLTPDHSELEVGGDRFHELVDAADLTSPCVVVDASAITDSPQLLRSLSHASDVVLVLRLGADGMSEAAGVVAAAGSGGGRISAALTRRSLLASVPMPTSWKNGTSRA